MMKRKKRRTMQGKVISNKMDKTVVVVVERQFPHPVYKKIIRRRTKIKAHDEENKCNIGDRVKVAETRPLSKEKCWRVVEVLEAAK
ncbi:MAG: 30S ribosomal protein S17 [Candidatus Eremiobacteraeota bacterium]|nr:30S ribosomal protein S17 [Candidatus Eremiobacteraeota bacterium]